MLFLMLKMFLNVEEGEFSKSYVLMWIMGWVWNWDHIFEIMYELWLDCILSIDIYVLIEIFDNLSY